MSKRAHGAIAHGSADEHRLALRNDRRVLQLVHAFDLLIGAFRPTA